MGRLWVNHGGDVYSGGEQLGDALEVLADSMRVLYVNRNGVKYWTERIRERDRMGETFANFLGDVFGLYVLFFR